MGKGSRSRITDKKRYDDNYDRIYGAQMKRAQDNFELTCKIAPWNGKRKHEDTLPPKSV